MMNLNNREKAIMLAKELQGKDIKEALDYARELSSIDYGCTVSVDVQDISSEDEGTFWMYIKLMFLDEDREILTESIGLEQLGVVATVTPSKDELCRVIKSKRFDIDVNQEMEDIIDELTGVLKFPFNDIEILDIFSNVSYQWEVWPTEEDMVDWNDLEEE